MSQRQRIKVNIFKRFYLFIFREKEGRRKRADKHQILARPKWGPGLQPRHVAWLGIKPVTFQFAGWHSIHWATPARAQREFLKSTLNRMEIKNTTYQYLWNATKIDLQGTFIMLHAYINIKGKVSNQQS